LATSGPQAEIVERWHDMDWQTVTSSTIERVAYDERSMTMNIEFKNGSVYQYFDVPSTVFSELANSGSPGQYLAQNVKRSYRFARA